MAKLLSNASAKWITEQRRKATSVVTRMVRKPFVSAGGFLGWRQWHCNIVDGKLRVRSGSVAWGGGHYAVWPSGRTVARSNYKTISGGPAGFVIWYTKVAPCPLHHCPKAPNGNAECPAPGGNPENWKADAGSITIAEKPERGEGWTDYRVIATVTKTGTDTYTVNQIQTAEIVVNAIVYPGETGEESEDEDDEDIKDCSSADRSKFPSSVDDSSGPQNPEDANEIGGNSGEDEPFPSKIDACW